MSTSPSMIRVLTVDDHALLREGIAALVNAEPDMKLVAEASDGEEAIKQFRQHHPDVTLMHSNAELNGIRISRIRNEFPNARIISCRTYSGDVQVPPRQQSGCSGIHLEGPRAQRMLDAIRSVHTGHKRIPPKARQS